MVEITGRDHTFCDGLRRREFVRAGFLGVAGLTLADLFRLEQAQAEQGRPVRDNKSVILIWMHGGPSQLDTFDLKPDATDKVRGPYQPISTNLPGVQVSELLPRTATIMDKVTIHRCMTTPNNEHWSAARWFLTGYLTLADPRMPKWPAMGSIAAKVLGAKQPGVPPYIVMNDGGFGHHGAHYLGNQHSPLRVGKEGFGNEAGLTGVIAIDEKELLPNATVARLEQRKHLLSQLDTLRRDFDRRLDGAHASQQKAFDLLLGPQARSAFDVDQESAATRELYGDRWGRDALLARRLVEHGARFVTCNTGYWDDHGNLKRALDRKLPIQDRMWHALLTDLDQRGMLEDTLVIAAGEFGRTPQINDGAGRDHWGPTQSILIAGGKYRHGQVIGRTDATAAYPVDQQIKPEDLCALVYHHLGLDTELTFEDHSGRPTHVLHGGVVPRELL